METPGSQFLHQRDPSLHNSQEVQGVIDYLNQNGEHIPNQPSDKISAYLGFLANKNFVNDGILTGDQASIDRQIDAHVIKATEVPESYFELQRRIAREQGHGDIEITRDMRHQLTEAVQSDQRAGLAKWVEYLGGDDGGYPDWFKHYSWTSVTKLGVYDKEKGEFQKRSRGTTAPYPELNREALAYVYDALNKSRVRGERVDGGERNEQLQRLLTNGNFGKLYAHAVLAVTPDNPELKKDTRGSWTKFNQSEDPRTARRLSGSLQGHGTGWCTAGESTAAAQLQGGDFYVYYTRDEDGKDTVPRVAIRMQNGEVAEVRGVNANQNLEGEMADIAMEKLTGLPGGLEYQKKADDMKRLTAIEKNVHKPLSSEDLRFLYELDRDIQGFGYERDPRIAEIRHKRGEQDKPELSRLLPETIRGQLGTAFAAYKVVADKLLGTAKRGLFGGRTKTAASAQEFAQVFAAKEQEWRTHGVYDYLVEQLIESGARFSLVATPNVAASEAQVVRLAEDFGKDQPYETYVYDDLYRKGRYGAREWSGADGTAPVRLSLMPSRSDNELRNKSAEQQMVVLRERQAKRPELHLRVPSVLDAVTYWYTLRAGGDKLADGTTFDKTYIRHFDLPPVGLDRWSFVPRSYVFVGGGPALDNSVAEDDGKARLSVG
jgi:hypothetical protein